MTSKTWFIIVTLIVFFPVGIFFMWKHKKFNMPIRVIISVFFGLAIVANIGEEEPIAEEEPVEEVVEVEKEEPKVEKEIEKEEPKEKPKEEVVKKEEKKKDKPKEKSPKEKFEEAMDKITLAELTSVEGNFDEEPFTVEVEFISKDNLTKNLTTSSMKLAVIDALYVVKGSTYEVETLGVEIQMPLVDKYGNEENDYVIRSEFTNEAIEQLSDEKFNVNPDNLDVIADIWWEHPAIRD